MNGPNAPGEFETIARLLRPLAQAHPGALDLLDDAAVLPGRPGYDLVVSKDAMVAGVHFLADTPLDLVGRRLLRTALSDLAAKAAEPFGWFLAIAWPVGAGWADREAFAKGLAQDGAFYGVALLGGDTVSTPGPLTLSATVMGWVPAGRMIRRGGGRAGDLLVVSGAVGDGWLGLQVATGELDANQALLERYQLPQPRLGLRDAIQAHARASADVSDGLLADAGHIATASRLSAQIDLEALPLSPSAQAWLHGQPDHAAALSALATGGDDYEVIAAVAPEDLTAYAAAAGMPVTVVGRLLDGQGVQVRLAGAALALDRLGYRHGG
jgi:thiamine-monophosphate kinase